MPDYLALKAEPQRISCESAGVYLSYLAGTEA